MNLIFLGPPGAGKGTVASKLKDILGLPHISTGDLFRAAIKNETDLGKKVKLIIEKGELVPDQLTVELVKERLSKDDTAKGYILDGFPRTITQAEALETFTKIDSVINLEIEKEKVIKRLSGRRLCKECGEGYHIEYMPPKKTNTCDKCGGELYTRKDDNIESISNRLEIYTKETQPLINFYTEKNLIKNFDSSLAADKVVENVANFTKSL
ncbi:MAG: adenylate kinase [Spirochaetales bacterium]|nr:adenylate kinase [Spirochaetales bacterium]